MKKSTMVCWLIASILMIIAGIVCFCLPLDTTMTTFAYIIGAMVLVAGIAELAVYFTLGGFLGTGMFLIDGIITVIFGIVLLANEDIVVGFLPFIFGMWFIIEGISEFSMSVSAARLHIPYTWALMILSLCEIIFGFVSLLDPVSGAISMTVMAGIFLLVQGVSMLSDWFVILRTKKYVKNITSPYIE